MIDVPKRCECGKQFTEEQSSGKWCYRCKLDGLAVTFIGGGGYGRKQFHDQTVGEFCRREEAAASAKGFTLEKKSTRAVLV